MPRLFVAAWPSAEAVEVLASVPRPTFDAVRWSSPEQWHVTLRFLGPVEDGLVGEVVGALGGLNSWAAEAVLGPATRRLGRGVLMVPVTGLDGVADEVRGRTAPYLARPDDQPFVGHLTLARGRGRAPVPPSLAGTAVVASWLADEVVLVQSRTLPSGAEYGVIARFPLQGA